MTNVQQPEMRRSGDNPLVQESKEPRPGDRPGSSSNRGRPVPAGQVSPYGPAPRPLARDGDRGDTG